MWTLVCIWLWYELPLLTTNDTKNFELSFQAVNDDGGWDDLDELFDEGGEEPPKSWNETDKQFLAPCLGLVKVSPLWSLHRGSETRITEADVKI